MKILMNLVISVLVIGVTARAEMPAVHGMVVFGNANSTYAYHLPMFHFPHDRQVILKIALKDITGSRALEFYTAAKRAGKTLFTVEPEVMELEKIVNGNKKQLIAALYDGHFERGGKNLGKIKLVIKKVIFASKLNSQTPPQETEKYFVFGENGAYFATHLIQGKPSFDAILEIEQPYQLLSAPCHFRVCPEPKKITVPDKKLPLALEGPGDPEVFHENSPQSLGDLSDGIADVKKLLYLEEGDLSN